MSSELRVQSRELWVLVNALVIVVVKVKIIVRLGDVGCGRWRRRWRLW
jgi:hypothetical protein